MFIGAPKEIKADEYRVGLIPLVVFELTSRGHQVAVESGAGQGAGIGDDEYAAAGAKIENIRRCRSNIRRSGPDRKGERAARAGTSEASARPDHLHLPAPRCGPRSSPRSFAVRGHSHRLRDRHWLSRKTAAACPDVPG